MRTRKPKITLKWLRSIQLDETERLKLSLFVGHHRNWTLRHAVPLENVIRHCLQEERLELLRLHRVEPHPLYELLLRLGSGRPSTKTGVERAVRVAFGCAGRVVRRGHVCARIAGGRARVTVLVDERRGQGCAQGSDYR